MDNYIYPYSPVDELLARVHQDLRYYLLYANTALVDRALTNFSELVGLELYPTFVVREGSGAPGDESIIGTVTHGGADGVLFADDDPTGMPTVMIRGKGISDHMRWRFTQNLYEIQFVLDCSANEATGAVTAGAVPRSADDILAGAVFGLLQPENARIALRERGFTNRSVELGADVDDEWTYTNPITLTFEVYQYNS